MNEPENWDARYYLDDDDPIRDLRIDIEDIAQEGTSPPNPEEQQ